MQTLFGKKTEEQLAARKAADGEFGYEVIAQDTSTGASTSLGFTTVTYMKVKKQSKTTNYIVKTCLSNMRATQSSGISIEVKGSGGSGGGGGSSTIITYKLNGNESDSAEVNKAYQDPGIIAYDSGVDITSKAKITVSCPELGTSKGQKESYTFTKAGTYTLKYTISYNGATETATRTITVKDTEPQPQPEPQPNP